MDRRLETAATVGGSENVAALLAFYRERFDAFEAERAEWLERVSATEVAHAEQHRNRWELKVRQEEIAELQRALSDATLQVSEERQEAIKLLAENDQLRLQQSEDSKRIQHLLALTEPVSQEVTFFKDCRPYLMTRRLQASAASTTEEKSTPVKVTPNHKLQTSSVQTNKNVLRTIYLPNEQTEGLTLRLAALEKELAEYQSVSQERITVLERERAEREAAFQQEKKQLELQRDAAEKKLELSERACRVATKDYLELRHSAQQAERGSVERAVALEQENAQLKTQLNSLSDKLNKETDAIRSCIIEDGERQVERFRKQVILAEDQLFKEKQRNAAELREAREKIYELSNQVDQLRKKYANEKKRRQLDFEGFQNDVQELRKHVRALETVVYTKPLDGAEDPFLNSKENTKAKPAPSPPGRTEALTYEQKMRNRAELLRHSIDALRKRVEHLDPHSLAVQEPLAPTKHTNLKPEWL